MAGSGYKNFTTGSVLTASDVQNYLMDQSVMVFAGTASRGSAITSPSEGMVVYLSDTDTVQVYNGTSWSAVGGGAAVLSNTPTGTYTDAGGTAWAYYEFTASGTATVTKAGFADVLVVGGGGGAGYVDPGYYSGGGGAGGCWESTGRYLTAGSYSVTVGAGGAVGTSTHRTGYAGGLSSIGTSFIIPGGGGGASYIGSQQVAGDGGSGGGGGAGNGSAAPNAYGRALLGSSVGYDGGISNGNYSNSAAGGGGAGAVGTGNTSDTVGGAGGSGKASSITGSAVTRAGGGGGGGITAGAGGSGGGGTGGNNSVAATAGTANTGGGGGGGGSAGVAAGGSGIVIIRVRT